MVRSLARIQAAALISKSGFESIRRCHRKLRKLLGLDHLRGHNHAKTAAHIHDAGGYPFPEAVNTSRAGSALLRCPTDASSRGLPPHSRRHFQHVSLQDGAHRRNGSMSSKTSCLQPLPMNPISGTGQLFSIASAPKPYPAIKRWLADRQLVQPVQRIEIGSKAFAPLSSETTQRHFNPCGFNHLPAIFAPSFTLGASS